MHVRVRVCVCAYCARACMFVRMCVHVMKGRAGMGEPSGEIHVHAYGSAQQEVGDHVCLYYKI